MSYTSPGLPTPALDFLRRVEIWQNTPGGTAEPVTASPFEVQIAEKRRDFEWQSLLAHLAHAGPEGVDLT